METGKRICQALKELRKRIADANDIQFEIEECTHKGDCPGTCPKCEGELQYLMDSLRKREEDGKPIAIDGLMSEEELYSAFSFEPIDVEVLKNPEQSRTMGMPAPVNEIEGGMLPIPEPYGRLMGDVAAPTLDDFASIIMKELMAYSDDNIVFSPAGLYCMLEILREGMDYQSTIYEKVDELVFRPNCGISTINNEHFTLEHASSVWYNKSLGKIKEEFLDTLEDMYETKSFHANFSNQEETKYNIDEWVSDNTHSMIKHLDSEISKDALIILLDAIYMKGKWQNPFDPDLTDTDTFRNADGTESDVDMMYQNIEDAAYAESDEYQAIHLPYRDNDFSMIVVLPKEGVNIDSVMENTGWLDCYTDECEVDLYMPRFNFDNTLSFVNILKKLGLKEIFEKENSFPKITDEPAHISQIKQQCVINVSEEGTEAAALTIAEMELGCPPTEDMPQTVEMKLDRPFGFAIKAPNGQLLFEGVIKKM